MLTSERNIRLIFGLKVKQLRQAKNLSFKELSENSGLSISYLNEIEKGKKYPKTEKIVSLSESLGITYDELVSLKLPKKWEPITDLLSSGVLDRLPLERFGLEVGTIMEIISTAPVKINAFISTILKIARNYEMSQEHFYFAALRSYQEMHDNYFEDLEEKVEEFVKKYELDITPPVHRTQMYDILRDVYSYTIDKTSLTTYPEFKGLRSVFLPGQKRLMINDTLSNTQKSFLLGKELAFNYLGLKERPYTSTPFKVESFEEVLNNFKASYFSVALFMNRHLLREDVEQLFNQEKWDGDGLLKVMRKYAASPEMFLSRLINILTYNYKINDLFFLRFNNQTDSNSFSISKELHLTRLHQPHRNDLKEHYCRRWVSIRTLEQLKTHPERQSPEGYHLDAQISSYVGSKQEYFCISIARPNSPTPHTNVSVTLGIRVDAQTRKKLRFLSDPNLPLRQVNETCERCPLTDCSERAAPPVLVEAEIRQKAIEARMKSLEEGELVS